MSTALFFLTDVLSRFNLGQQIIIVATLGIAALYLVRSRKVARSAASTMSLAWFMAVAVVVSAGVAIYLGWVDPYPGSFIGDVSTGANAVFDVLRDLFRRFVP